eukprot:CFRG0536T1
MGRYYCDYCDAYLTHDSASVRKTHNHGRKHKDNVRLYYQNWVEKHHPGGLASVPTPGFGGFPGQPGMGPPMGMPGMGPPGGPIMPGMGPPMGMPGMGPPMVMAGMGPSGGPMMGMGMGPLGGAMGSMSGPMGQGPPQGMGPGGPNGYQGPPPSMDQGQFNQSDRSSFGGSAPNSNFDGTSAGMCGFQGGNMDFNRGVSFDGPPPGMSNQHQVSYGAPPNGPPGGAPPQW